MQSINILKGYKASFCIILCLVLFLCACGEKVTEKNYSPSKKTTKVEEKTFTFYLDDPEGFDPAYANTMDFAKIGQGIFEGLVRFKKTSTEIEPALATNWEISPDLKTYTFSLRKDVKFHDGTKFNADSVLYSFERQLKEKRKENMSLASFIFDIVSKIEKKDDYTIKFTLSEPSIIFLTNLAMFLGSPIIGSDSHKKDEVAFAQNPVGTGPYKMTKYEKGKIIELAINKDYWGEKAKIEKIIVLLEKKDKPEELVELSNGKIDMLELENELNISKLNPDKIKIEKLNSAVTYFLCYNCSKQPFNDRNFREGISRLIDRDKYIKNNFDIGGETAETLIPPSIFGFNSKVRGNSFNISKANELLKNFPINKELSLITNSKGFGSLTKFITESLEKNGIKVKTDVIDDYDVYLERILSNNYDISIDGWTSDNGDPDNFMFLLHSLSIGKFNFSKFSNKEFDKMIDKGKKILNIHERINIYKEAEELLSKEVPILPLFHGMDVFGRSTRIKNFNFHPSGVFMFQYFDKD